MELHAKIDNYVSVSGSNENVVGTAFSHTQMVYVYCIVVSSSSMRGRTDNDNAFIVHYCVYVVVLI